MIGRPDDASASTMVLPVVPSNRWSGIQLEYPMQLSLLRRSAESMLCLLMQRCIIGCRGTLGLLVDSRGTLGLLMQCGMIACRGTLSLLTQCGMIACRGTLSLLMQCGMIACRGTLSLLMQCVMIACRGTLSLLMQCDMIACRGTLILLMQCDMIDCRGMLRLLLGTWMTFWSAMSWSPTGSLNVPIPFDLMLGPAVVTSVARSSYVWNHSFRAQK